MRRFELVASNASNCALFQTKSALNLVLNSVIKLRPSVRSPRLVISSGSKAVLGKNLVRPPPKNTSIPSPIPPRPKLSIACAAMSLMAEPAGILPLCSQSRVEVWA